MAAAETFTIRAAAGTDVWRKPPSTDVFNGACQRLLLFILLLLLRSRKETP